MRPAACVCGVVLLLVGLLGGTWLWWADDSYLDGAPEAVHIVLGTAGSLALMCWGSRLILWATS